jgi:CheY-like chemotaxis protein
VAAGDGKPIRYLLSNLSVGGALLTGGPLLPVGASVRAELEIAGGPRLSTLGEVVRRDAPDTPEGWLALAFRGLAPSDEDAIQDAVLRGLEAEARGQRPPRTVLVVDDSALQAEALRKDLVALGHAPLTAFTRIDAIQRASDPHTRFDVVIVDLHLSDSGGLDLLRYFSEHHPGARRVLMAGSVRPAQLELARRAGCADAILAKPWARADLDQVVGG